MAPTRPTPSWLCSRHGYPSIGRANLWRSATARLRTAGTRILWGFDLEKLFDRSFYLNRYPDVARSGVHPVAHFLLYGAAEGRQPHPLFDTAGYLAANPDVAAAGQNPLLHFLRYGWKEQRRPNALFDAEWYRTQHPELGPDQNPFLDYVKRRAAGESIAGAPDWREFLPVEGIGEDAAVSSLPVDVIIPVYRGMEQTRACLESVLRARSRTPVDVVVVNDASPEADLSAWLRGYAAEHSLTLIENAANLGFVESVNRAMERHPDRDVVLLNNDTEVAGDWLDRLAAAARAAPRIGTVTPFSNDATICSYPLYCQRNPLPAGMAVGAVDDVFRVVNRGRRVAMPTAVGFCMYIRRDCLRETGAFNAQAFGKGYGEENDFSMRAAEKGWQHVLAADVFVYHAGEGSFGEEAAARRAAAQRVIQRLHPEYESLVGRHVPRDPARPYRFAASAWRLRHSTKPVILAVSHSLGGGVEQHLVELRAVLGEGAEMLALTPLAGGLVMLRNLNPADAFEIVLDAADYAGVLAVLQSCGIDRVHVHHLMGHVLDIEKLCRDLGVAFDFTAHDYFAVCPQVKMADRSGRYCGAPDQDGCNRCLAERPADPALDIDSWRRKYGWLGKAERVITPSSDAAARLQRYFPGSSMIAAAHPSPVTKARISVARLAAEAPLRIAATGVMTREKGLHNLSACAERAKLRGLPLEFVLAGYVEKGLPGEYAFLQTGRYENRGARELLLSLGAHLVWYPTVWPETFSYTLNICLEAEMPVVAPSIGAFPERVDGRAWSWIVPWSWTPDEFLDFFLRIRQENFVRGIAPDIPQAAAVAERAQGGFYPGEYLAQIRVTRPNLVR